MSKIWLHHKSEGSRVFEYSDISDLADLAQRGWTQKRHPDPEGSAPAAATAQPVGASIGEVRTILAQVRKEYAEYKATAEWEKGKLQQKLAAAEAKIAELLAVPKVKPKATQVAS